MQLKSMFQCLSKQTAPIINSRAVFYDVITYGTVLGMIAGIISHGLPLILYTHTHTRPMAAPRQPHTHTHLYHVELGNTILLQSQRQRNAGTP